jgi:hypothetical protein
MGEPHDALDEDPWRPPSEPYFIGAAGSIAGMRREAQGAGEADLIDFARAPRPKRRWILFRRRFRTERARYQAELDSWYVRARREAGLPRMPTVTDMERHFREHLPWPDHPDPEINAALRRLREYWDEIPARRAGLSLEGDVIVVDIRPYRERVAQRIKEICHPVPVTVERASRDS